MTDKQQSTKMVLQVINADSAGKLSDMESYSAKARWLIESRENMGSFENPDALGRFRGWCGDSMQIEFRLVDGVIREARFTTDGCGASIACGSMATKLVCSKTLTEAMQITPQDVLTALGGIPKDHEHCAELAVRTLQETVKNADAGHGQTI